MNGWRLPRGSIVYRRTTTHEDDAAGLVRPYVMTPEEWLRTRLPAAVWRPVRTGAAHPGRSGRG